MLGTSDDLFLQLPDLLVGPAPYQQSLDLAHLVSDARKHVGVFAELASVGSYPDEWPPLCEDVEASVPEGTPPLRAGMSVAVSIDTRYQRPLPEVGR